MATEIGETEREYDLEPGALLPSLDDLPSVAQESDLPEQTLDADYYDTADLRLVRSGVLWGGRGGGTDQGCPLRLPLQADSRREIRLPLGRARRVPAELAALVLADARGAALQPVALITTTRRGRALPDGEGTPLAEVVTDDLPGTSFAAPADLRPGQRSQPAHCRRSISNGAARPVHDAGENAVFPDGVAGPEVVVRQHARRTSEKFPAGSNEAGRRSADGGERPSRPVKDALKFGEAVQRRRLDPRKCAAQLPALDNSNRSSHTG